MFACAISFVIELQSVSASGSLFSFASPIILLFLTLWWPPADIVLRTPFFWWRLRFRFGITLSPRTARPPCAHPAHWRRWRWDSRSPRILLLLSLTGRRSSPSQYGRSGSVEGNLSWASWESVSCRDFLLPS